MPQRLALNVFSNWADALVAALLGILVTPYLIEGLKDPSGGNAVYGVLVFAVSLSAYFGLLDLGFYQGVIQYFTRFRSQDQVREFNRLASTAAFALAASAAVAIGLALLLAWTFPSLIEIGSLTDREAGLTALFLSLGVILRVPLQVFAAVIVGCTRFEVLNSINVLGRLVTAGLVLSALATGEGIVAVAAATSVGMLVSPIGHLWAAFRVEPRLHIDRRLFDRGALAKTFDYGKWMFGVHLYDLYVANIDLIIVPLLFGSEALAVYAIAISLVTQAQIGVHGYTWVLTPSAIAADATGDAQAMRSLVLRSTRVGLILGGFVALGAAFWGERFLFLWLGDPSFLWDAEFVSAATVLTIAAFDRVLLQGLAGPQQALVGLRRVRELCSIKLVQGVCGAAAALVLGQRFGIIAVPWALLFTSIAGRSWMTWRACRLIPMPLGSFLRSALLPALATLLCCGIVASVVSRLALTGWSGLLAEALVFVFLGLPIAFALGLDAPERSVLLSRLRRRR